MQLFYAVNVHTLVLTIGKFKLSGINNMNNHVIM